MRDSPEVFQPILAYIVIAISLGLGGCSGDDHWAEFQSQSQVRVLLSDSKTRDIANREPLRAISAYDIAQIPKEMASLGNFLYHDLRLSGDKTLSCASCHGVHTGGVDGVPVSKGINGALGGINAPTVLNSGFNFRQFWDGRAKTLQDQAAGPVANPIEMGAKWEVVVVELNQDKGLRERFKRVFGDPEITQDRVTRAIADFEKTLFTPAPFDRYLLGDENAISEKAKQGYQIFKQRGCIACHQGINIGGNLYQKFGAIQTYFESQSSADDGLGARTKESEDISVFKVPSLRNIALTAPYFHNAGAQDLPTAIKIMGVMQLGRVLPDEDIEKIEAFLHTLTGDVNLVEAEL